MKPISARALGVLPDPAKEALRRSGWSGRHLLTLFLSSVPLAACSPPAAPAKSPPLTATSDQGTFRVTAVSEVVPVPVNEIHHWRLRVETGDGQPVSNARIVIYGGMPEHQHGLPTVPRVTRELGAGEYLVEGMKFNMPGLWELKLTVWAGEATDQVTFEVVLE